MTRMEWIAKMVAKGKVTQVQADKFIAKEKAIEEAKAKYIKDKSKLTKAEIQVLFDVVCQ